MTDTKLPAVIRWENPPFTSHGRHLRRRPSVADDPYTPLAEQLRANPGRWAVVAESAPNTYLASAINGGRTPAWQPAGYFEGASRKIGDWYTVWARFVGEDE
jgi:hypothetical protein